MYFQISDRLSTSNPGNDNPLSGYLITVSQVDVMLPDMDQELAALPQKFSDTDAKKVFYRTSVFLTVPLITLLLFAGIDCYTYNDVIVVHDFIEFHRRSLEHLTVFKLE